MAGKISKGDIEILSFIAEYKFLTVKQLAALTKRTTQVVRRRLRHLKNEHLIIMNERGVGAGCGKPENIIILTQKGIERLQGWKILSDHATYITDKTMEPMFISHELLVNWFFIHLIQIGRDNRQLITQHLTKSSHNLKEGNIDSPFLKELFTKDDASENTHTMVPDGVFTIADKLSKKTLLFFLEVDMGTETLVNTKRGPGDIRQKIINYQSIFRTCRYKRYKKAFQSEFNGFRLLFLTNSFGRMKKMCDLVERMPPSDFIWLTDQERLFSKGLSAEIWARGGKYHKSSESILGPKLRSDAPFVNKIR
jgi:hypothetical protein